jgi:hypothetical protein
VDDVEGDEVSNYITRKEIKKKRNNTKKESRCHSTVRGGGNF